MPQESPRESLTRRFRAAARRLRARLALRRSLTGAALSLTAGAFAALAVVAVHRLALAHPLWHPYGRWVRPAFAATGALGVVAGLLVARRRRPDDTAVALFLDARLHTGEAIVTALDVEPSVADAASPGAVGPLVIARGLRALEAMRPSDVRVSVLRRVHALIPVALAAIAVAARIPVAPKPPPSLPAPGSAEARASDVKGLAEAIALASIPPRDDAQRERLKKIADEAARIRDEAKNGASERDVKADVAKLGDAIEKERMSLGSSDDRRGYEAALGALQKNPDLAPAARAFGEHDLSAFDREMQRALASKDRDAAARARESLRAAEDAARRAGAEDVARALADEQQAQGEASRRGGADPHEGDAKAPGERTSARAGAAGESPEAARDRAMREAEAALGPSGDALSPAGAAGNDALSPAGAAGNDETDSARGPSGKSAATPTGKIAADETRLKAKASGHGGATLPGGDAGRAPSRPGETANARGTGALATVGADEISGVNASDVPEAYREQVGEYFRP